MKLQSNRSESGNGRLLSRFAVDPLLDKVGSGRRPYEEGARARLAGTNRDDCPYSGVIEAEQWRAGWDEEDRLLYA